jgi:predicted transcriptional regulator
MKKVLRWVILGTKGGYNRAKIIKTLHDIPSNAHQLSKKLDLNYRTITNHLDILEEMSVVESSGKKYGKVYMLSDRMETHYDEFKEIWAQLNE